MSPLKLEYHNKPLKVSNDVIDAELKSWNKGIIKAWEQLHHIFS